MVFYLCKDGEQVFLDISELPQHQLDGIRFLYFQFKKKKAGVILNDPSGYGKTLQVVLFLQAVRNLLASPILVLCNEDDITNWEEHFYKWTNYSNEDVGIESPNIFTKKVHIDKLSNYTAWTRRNLSVLVIHNDNVATNVLRTAFTADYRIWISSIDLKNNLQILSPIYNWLYPNEFDIKRFTAKKNCPKDIVSKAVFLDAFLEDIVIRRNNLKIAFEKSKNPASATKTPKVSRKNKDSTGTKIKRTKRKLENNTDPPSTLEDINIIHNAISDVTNEVTNDNVNNSITDESNMDIETFIRDRKPIVSDGYDEFIKDYDNVIVSRSEIVNVSDVLTDSKCTLNEIKNNTSIKVKDIAVDITKKSENNTSINVKGEDVAMDITKQDDDSTTINIENKDVDMDVTKNADNRTPLHVKDEDVVLDITKQADGNLKKIRKYDEIDSKIKELEEKTFKKYKNSILDSIF